MKPREKKPETVFRIIDRASGEPRGSYSRACCDEYDFNSVEEARTANCHGEFANRAKYGIAKYRVTYELIEEDVDPPTPEEIESERISNEKRAALESEMDAKGLKGMERESYAFNKAVEDTFSEIYKSLSPENKKP